MTWTYYTTPVHAYQTRQHVLAIRFWRRDLILTWCWA